MNGKLDDAAYLAMLEACLMPLKLEHNPKGRVFQQDGAPAHCTKHTRDFFGFWVADMDLPPNFPDLNCLDNLWRALVHAFYEKNPLVQ